MLYVWIEDPAVLLNGWGYGDWRRSDLRRDLRMPPGIPDGEQDHDGQRGSLGEDRPVS